MHRSDTQKTMAMARILPFLASEFIILTLLSSLVVLRVAGDNPEYVRSLDRKLFGLKQEKLSHFHMYWHDTYSGPNPSAMALIRPTNTTPTGFGFVSMIDDPLTVGPELSSKLIGKAQGFYAQASQQDVGLLMTMNFVFLEGKYNGSTITIVGRNKVFSKVREMPVVGGSGLFRFARGYAQASTHSFSQTTGDAVVEYNLYVLHY